MFSKFAWKLHFGPKFFCVGVCMWVGWTIITFVISPLQRITLWVVDVICFFWHRPFKFYQVRRLVALTKIVPSNKCLCTAEEWSFLFVMSCYIISAKVECSRRNIISIEHFLKMLKVKKNKRKKHGWATSTLFCNQRRNRNQHICRSQYLPDWVSLVT